MDPQRPSVIYQILFWEEEGENVNCKALSSSLTWKVIGWTFCVLNLGRTLRIQSTNGAVYIVAWQDFKVGIKLPLQFLNETCKIKKIKVVVEELCLWPEYIWICYYYRVMKPG